MTKLNNNKVILIISLDKPLINNIKNVFSDHTIISYSKDFKNFDDVNLIILDDYNSENLSLIEKILVKKHSINISSKHYENIINLKRPFLLADLFLTINLLLLNNDKILKFKDFEIIDNILKLKDKEIIFGNKEISLIKYLYHNKESTKSNLLEKIWNYNQEIETKVLENTVNKIRKKFKSDFIVYNNGKYTLNKIYL